MVKHTQTIRRQKADNCLSVLHHFVGLVLERLKIKNFRLDETLLFITLQGPDRKNKEKKVTYSRLWHK